MTGWLVHLKITHKLAAPLPLLLVAIGGVPWEVGASTRRMAEATDGARGVTGAA